MLIKIPTTPNKWNTEVKFRVYRNSRRRLESSTQKRSDEVSRFHNTFTEESLNDWGWEAVQAWPEAYKYIYHKNGHTGRCAGPSINNQYHA